MLNIVKLAETVHLTLDQDLWVTSVEILVL